MLLTVPAASANPVDDVRELADPVIFCVGSGEGEGCPQLCGGGAGTCVDAVVDAACEELGECGPGAVQTVFDRVCDWDCQQTLQDVVTAVEESDQDGDNVPDVVESEACGRPAVRSQIDGSTVPGRCATTTDYKLTG